MKKLLYILVTSMVLFSSCTKEDDPIFDKSPEERLSSVLLEYKAKLTQGDGYWIAYYSGSAILMKFNEDNTVEFKSTYNGGKDDRTITYRVGASQVPELIFENYSVFHAIYEDNRSTGEYEFLFDVLSDDKIEFISKTDIGADKTRLNFYKSTIDELEKVSALREKVEVLSVFKQVIVNQTPDYLASLSLALDGSAILQVSEGGVVSKKGYNYDVTSNGLLFTPALTVANGLKVSEFVFDEATKIFNSIGVEGVSIVEKLEPVIPLLPYAFGVIKDAMRYNYMEESKSSPAFMNFYKAYEASTVADHGVTIQKWYFRQLLPTTDNPYFQIYFGYGGKDYSAKYYFTYEVKVDGKVYFSLTGSDANAKFLDAVFQPLVQKIFNTTGHYIENTGGLLNYTNGTLSLINADDPAYRINFYDF